ncbi:MAG: bifunctional hydroxymethylpyrimidine kinase/phosphomethylpyrimidine kinase [Treponema sp.]|nr:bifunctional hydroxymethylpyrimidine kinase/phosphomethylpyrimidine kinase [Treponema sp.]
MKTALTIAGSDSSGGAGIQADIKTMTANGVYAMSAITALTAQNTTGVFAVQVTETEILKKQIEAVATDIFPDAVKTGMIPTEEQAHSIAESIKKFNFRNIVVDPVIVSTSGTKLISDEAISKIQKELFPLSTLITPNIPEAEFMLSTKIQTKEQMEKAAETLSKKYGCSVLMKGGHMVNDACDFLFKKDGDGIWFDGKRVDNKNTHGTGCTLSSAIASNLAKGLSLEESVLEAKKYLTLALEAMLDLGKGSGPLCHNFKFL